MHHERKTYKINVRNQGRLKDFSYICGRKKLNMS